MENSINLFSCPKYRQTDICVYIFSLSLSPSIPPYLFLSFLSSPLSSPLPDTHTDTYTHKNSSITLLCSKRSEPHRLLFSLCLYFYIMLLSDVQDIFFQYILEDKNLIPLVAKFHKCKVTKYENGTHKIPPMLRFASQCCFLVSVQSKQWSLGASTGASVGFLFSRLFPALYQQT